MSFVSEQFLLFLAAAAVLHFLLPGRFQKLMLLVASYAFALTFGPTALIGLVASALFNFVFARACARPGRGGSIALWAGVLSNIAALASLKYVSFFLSIVFGGPTMQAFTADVSFAERYAPVGLSFYTFQAISFLIDVRRKKLAPPSLLDTAIYLGFWPKLVAGPIIRAAPFIAQLQRPRQFRWANVWIAAEWAIYGLALKVCLGDYLAPLINRVFESPTLYTPTDNLAAVLMYTFQIYGDFAGYSLIAVGVARLLGYKIPQNFRRPNFASSFADFWSRWHISLSRFLSDYIYRSLPYRKSEAVIARNQIITLTASGLWHGAAWTFVAWGVMHGVFLAVNRQITRAYDRAGGLPRAVERALLLPLAIAIVFALVAFSRVFFRSESIAAAWPMLQRIAEGPLRLGAIAEPAGVAMAAAIALTVWTAELCIETGLWSRMKPNRMVRMAAAIGAVLFVVLLGEFSGGQFLYAQF